MFNMFNLKSKKERLTISIFREGLDNQRLNKIFINISLTFINLIFHLAIK